MKEKIKQILLSFFALLMPMFSFAQSLDKKIDELFTPIANAWESFVMTSVPITRDIQIPFVLILLIVGAVFFTLYFRFDNIRRFPLAIRVVQGKYDFVEKDAEEVRPDNDLITVDGDIPGTMKNEGAQGEVSHFQALSAALSGTIGMGNIAGVAIAIAMGGPGATFWMILAGFLGMSSKFVECTLGVKYRDVEDGIVYGGPMYYLSKGLGGMGYKNTGKILAFFFSIFCIGTSFGVGNAFQSNQAIAQITTQFNLQGGSIKIILGIIIAILVGLVIIGGIKRIGTVAEKIVPFMAIIYILACLIIIIVRYDMILPAFQSIVREAFTPAAGLGGAVGVLITGFRRAAFSNEAGVGSAPIAHAAVRTKYPASEGIVALLEPFLDTVVICTMTALVIILFNMDGQFIYGNLDTLSNVIITDSGRAVGGVDLTSLAFDAAIPGFSYVLTVAIVLFVISTMLSWSYYGLQAWKYLFGRTKKADITYKFLFLIFIVIGSATTLDAVMKFSDAMLLAMVVPNMIGLLMLSPKVREEMKRYIQAINQRFDTNH